MMRISIRNIVGAITAAAIACMLAAGMAASAIAASSPNVSGYDCYGIDEPISVLSVDGSAGDTIFVDVEKGGVRTAARLDYTLKSGEVAGVFDIDIDGQQALDDVVVRAYADRSGKELLYEGRIYPVYASLDGKDTQLIALRTLAAGEERSFVPEETLYLGTTNYCLERDAAGSPMVADADNTLTYSYKSYVPSQTAGGAIRYVDASGTTVYTQQIDAIPAGESKVMKIEPVFKSSNGSVYRSIAFTPTIVASNPGQRDFVVKCMKLDISTANQANYYVATINLVDEAGKLLASDSVSVIGKYVYTAPLTMYLEDDGKTIAYDIANKDQQTLRLDAQADGVTGGTKTFTITYKAQPADQPTVSVKYNLIDATKGKRDAGRTIGSDTVEVSAANPVAVPPQEALLVNGEPYVLAGSADMYKYDYNAGGIPEINAYYVPEDYVAPGPYDVKVQYVNLADNSVITTKTVQSSPDQLSDLEIETDKRFDHDGATYVRLSGQEQPILHNYYSNVRTYTVYYRNVNDDLTADTVITRLRVVYNDVAPVAIDAATGEPIADDATPLALNPDGTYNVVAGDGTGLITNEDGVDSNTERIEDAQNPLASGLEGLNLGAWMPAIIGVAAGVLAILIIALVVAGKRRRARETGDE